MLTKLIPSLAPSSSEEGMLMVIRRHDTSTFDAYAVWMIEAARGDFQVLDHNFGNLVRLRPL